MKKPTENFSSPVIDAIHREKHRGNIPVIAEIKKFSPAQGELMGDRTIASLVADYEAGGAACLSVVTGSWFKGSPSMLSEAASHTNLPILRKDTVVSRDQIKMSQDLGAAAVLLTSKILQKSHLEKMVDFCIKIGLTPFIEVSDQQELACVEPCKEMIIGIANRDIAKKEMDVESGLKSLALISDLTKRAGAIISASGISTRSEAEILINSGFDGLLVATSLLRAGNTMGKLSELVNGNANDQTIKVS